MAHFADSKILKIIGRSSNNYPIHELPFPGYQEAFPQNMNAETLAMHNECIRNNKAT